MSIRTSVLSSFILASLLGSSAPAQAGIKVVTTTEDLAALAREVGGDKISVESIAKGYQIRISSRPSPASS